MSTGADKDGGNDNDDEKDVRGNNPTAARIGLSRIAIPCQGGPITIDPLLALGEGSNVTCTSSSKSLGSK